MFGAAPHSKISPSAVSTALPPNKALRTRSLWHPEVLTTALFTGVNRCFNSFPPSRWLGRYQLRRVEFSRLRLTLPGLGRALDGYTLAFVSDLHAGSFIGSDDIAWLCERVAEFHPALVCLGGDLVNTRDRELDLLSRGLEVLAPEDGIVAVPGNHDYFRAVRPERWREFLEDRGVQILLNRGLRIARDGAALWIAGVDDFDEGWPDLTRALEGREDGTPTVLLAHHPDFFPHCSGRAVDLTLSGHTHGGQVKLFGRALVTHTRTRRAAGLFEDGPSRLYVGRGVGMTLLPLRIGCRSEVVIVELASGDADPTKG